MTEFIGVDIGRRGFRREIKLIDCMHLHDSLIGRSFVFCMFTYIVVVCVELKLPEVIVP